MNMNFKNIISSRIETHRTDAIMARINAFLKDFSLINEEDEYGSITFMNKRTGISTNFAYARPKPDTTFEDFKKEELKAYEHFQDIKRISAFVKDFVHLDRLDRIILVRQNVDKFDVNRALWLGSLTDDECKIIQKSSPKQLYLHMSGLEKIEGVKCALSAKSEFIWRTSPVLKDLERNPSPRPQITPAMAM